MKKVFLGLSTTALLGLLVNTAFAASSDRAEKAKTATTSEWVEEVSVDYTNDTHAGPGPHPTTESNRYQLTQGGIRWFSGSTIEYQISGTEAVSGGNTAVESAEATWDSFVTTRNFSRNDSTSQTNPCTGNPNTIQWAAIDGSGGVLATASVCRNVATKEIGGFVVTIDQEEFWATDGSAGNFDVENVVSHEFGHVAGLGHVNAPRDGCLSMYRYAGAGEIQKRTLGWGDKLGMNALYGSTDTSAGTCGS